MSAYSLTENGQSPENRYNIKIQSLVVFDEALYASTSNRMTGMEVWRLSDDMTWRQANVDGFGNSNNVKTLWSVATVVFDDNLCVGTDNSADGGEIWCSASLEPQVFLPLLLHSG
jgi:endo-1,4-beta-mannosidase